MDKIKTSDRLTAQESFLEDLRRHPEWRQGRLESFDPSKYEGITSDNVNHPPHYNNSPATCSCGRRVECIDVTRHYSFNVGNAIKYLWRCDLKGNAIEDLKKAKWYIEDEIAKREKFVC